MKAYILPVFLLLSITPFRPAFSQTSPASSTQVEKTQMSGDAHFLDMMTEHHRDGIKMAEMASQKAQSKEIKNLAVKMLRDQQKEVKQMQTWRENKFSVEPKMEAMSEKVDMSKLENADGKKFDKEFTDMMIQHHKDGIQMARENSNLLKDDEVKKFADNMIKNQTKEKEQLQKISSSLYGKKQS